MKFRRFIAMLLVFCMCTPKAYADWKKPPIIDSIGGQVSQVIESTSNWATQAASDVSSWATQAWKDSSDWVSAKWGTSSKWVSDNWENLMIWADMVVSDNPYSWMNDAVQRKGLLAFDRFSDLRSFLNTSPTLTQLHERVYSNLTDLSLLNEDKETIWNMLLEWSSKNNITQENVVTLSLPFLERLLIEDEIIFEGKEYEAPDIAQYLFTVLEAMDISSNEKAEKQLRFLDSTIEALTRPVIIGDDMQNILVTDDQCYIENFTYGDGKYQLFMLASLRSQNSEYPLWRGKSIEQVTQMYFPESVLQDQSELEISGAGKGKSIKFNSAVSETPIEGRAVAIWNDKNTYLFFIVTDGEWVDEEFDEWFTTISLSNQYSIDFSVDPASDGAFHGINQTSQKYTINRYFDEARFQVPHTGHGWAAERGNNLIDNIKGVFKGNHSTIVGDNNVKNGADRLVTYADGSKIYIQSKYYASAAKGIASCFENGEFRYFDAEGKPMKIEVPADQYDAALRDMRSRILNGEIAGVDDPSKAESIIQKGSLTYQQAKHIAQAGTVESILYDSAHGCVVASTSMGLSAAVELALSIWRGASFDEAIKGSIWRGLEVGGQSFVISVLSSQIAKSSINTAMIPASKVITHALGPKVSAVIVNAFRPAGSAIYGAAAMQSAAKLLRGGVITTTVTAAVLTAFDVADIIQGKISWKQLAKNATKTVAGVTGGYFGYLGGAAIGTAIFPGPGTVIGSIIGSVAAGVGTSAGAKAITDLIAEDDAEEMISIIETQFQSIALEYFLTEDEAMQAVANLQKNIKAGTLKEMFQSKDREAFARQLIEDSINPVVKERAHIDLPSDEEYAEYLTEVLEDIYEDVKQDED